jgi:hypothetical protein
LAQTHARPAAVLGNELDAGLLQGATDRGEGRAVLEGFGDVGLHGVGVGEPEVGPHEVEEEAEVMLEGG